MHPMLNIAVKAARKAGSIINRASIDVDLVRVTRKQHNELSKNGNAAMRPRRQ